MQTTSQLRLMSSGNMGQLKRAGKAVLLKVLGTFNAKGVFLVNPNKVTASHGAKLILSLKGKPCQPFMPCQPRISPHNVEVIQAEIHKLEEAGAIRRSTSGWAFNCVVVPKKDNTAPVCQDLRGLNQRLKDFSGGLGDMWGIYDDMHEAQWFTALDLTSGFTQLEIAEEDTFKVAFRDAYSIRYTRLSDGFRLLELAIDMDVLFKHDPRGFCVHGYCDSITAVHAVAYPNSP